MQEPLEARDTIKEADLEDRGMSSQAQEAEKLGQTGLFHKN